MHRLVGFKQILKNQNKFLCTSSIKNFAEWRNASELWTSAAPPANRISKSARGKRNTVKRVIDFQQGHNIAERSGRYIDGLHAIPVEIQTRIAKPGSNTIDAKYIRLTEEEIQDDALQKEERLRVRLEERNAQLMEDREEAFAKAGVTTFSWVGIEVPAFDPITTTGISFDDFVCRIIQVDRIGHMEPITGRVYQPRITIAMGNGKGSFSWGFALGENMGEAIRRARKFASTRIEQYEFYKGNTLFHDVTAIHLNHKLTMTRQPEGYGFRGNNIFKILCELVGLTDVAVKLGKTGVRKSQIGRIRAFQIALRSIESPEQIAKRTGYHVVQLDEQNWNKPHIIAEPDYSKGLQHANEDPMEPFDGSPSYFLQVIHKQKYKKRLRQKQIAKYQDRWCNPNYSNMGFGWRGVLMTDESMNRAYDAIWLRKMNHRFYRSKDVFTSSVMYTYKSTYELGDKNYGGKPFESYPEVPRIFKDLPNMDVNVESSYKNIMAQLEVDKLNKG